MYNPYNYMNNTNPYMGNVQPLQNVQPVQTPLQQTQGLIRVTGMEGAKAYQMPPNSLTALFDNNEDIFYVKSTDGAGFPTIKAYKFMPAEEPKQEQPTSNFVTRQEFEQLKEEVLNNAKQSVSKRSTKQDKPANDE